MTFRVRWVPFTNDPRVASVRLRSLRPVQYLKAAGTDAALLRNGGAGVDVAVFQKAYGEEHLRLAEALKARETRVILDMCDNHLFLPDEPSPELVARTHRVREMMSLADLVTVASRPLAALLGLSDAIVVDDALELPRQRTPARLARAFRSVPRERVLWFGTAGASDLPFGMRDLASVLRGEERSIPESKGLVVCSNSRDAYDALIAPLARRSVYVSWRRRTFPAVAGVCSVALLPVTENPYTAGKTSNRIATALLHGLPVVTDSLPSYRPYADFVSFGHHAAAVAAYLDDPQLRARHVQGGAALARQQYAPARITDQWLAAIERVLS